jgi:asparagine synthase (glutamine-hydrolysing)
MAGIVGLITRMPQEEAVRVLHRMTGALAGESFYSTGTSIEASQGVYVGWTTLNNSFAARMPLQGERGDVTLVFSGEDYPDRAEAAARSAAGQARDAEGPSYLVQAYEKDPAFPAGLNGTFHGIVIDRRRGTSTLFNDRFGMHRVFYHQSQDAFYFAAEAKAILAVRPELRTIDAKSLGEFIASSCVLENRTLFSGIAVLPQASAWTFRDGSLERRHTYFHPSEWERQEPLDSQAYVREMRETLSRNLPRYFAGEERIGMTLTGGLDTRVIMALRPAAPGSLPCYTFGGMFRDSEDVRVARQVASATGQSHEVLTVGREFLAQFPRYAERSVFLSEGSIDVGRAPDLYLSQKAREIAPVKIVGTYGSEIIRHAVNLESNAPPPGLYSAAVAPAIEQADTTYAVYRREHPVTFAAFRQASWQHSGVLGLEQTQLTVRSPYLDNDFVRLAFRAPAHAGTNGDIRLDLVGEGDPALAAIRTDRGTAGHARPIVSAATRALLDFQVKAEYAYDYGMPDWLARIDSGLKPLHLERLFLGRHKSSHFRLWYRDDLSAYVREMLLDDRALRRPYLERQAVEAAVQSHIGGVRNHTTDIHKLLTLELIHRLFLD